MKSRFGRGEGLKVAPGGANPRGVTPTGTGLAPTVYQAPRRPIEVEIADLLKFRRTSGKRWLAVRRASNCWGLFALSTADAHRAHRENTRS